MVAVSSRIPRSILVMRHRDFALVQVGNGVSQLGTWGQYVALGVGDPRAQLVAVRGRAQPGRPVPAVPAPRTLRRRTRRPEEPACGRGDRQPARGAAVDRARACWSPPGSRRSRSCSRSRRSGGIATALTQPAMSAVVGEIVPAVELPEAVASVSVMTNLTRILGPSFAAVVISGWGLQWAFYLNAASFFAVVLAWAFVRANTRRPLTHETFRTQLAVGLRFARSDAADPLPAVHHVRGHVRRVPRRAAPGDRDRPPARGCIGLRPPAGRRPARARSPAR